MEEKKEFEGSGRSGSGGKRAAGLCVLMLDNDFRRAFSFCLSRIPQCNTDVLCVHLIHLSIHLMYLCVFEKGTHITSPPSRQKQNFKVEGSRNDANGNVAAYLETKFSHAKGVAIKEKWTTSNNVTTEVTLDKLPLAGSKVIVETVFSPNSG